MSGASCHACEQPLEAGALSCPSCGEPVEPEKTKKLGPIVSGFGALFLGIGPFLPWLTYNIETVSGVEETRKQALILVGLAVFSAMFSLSALTGKKFTGLRGNILAGLVAGGLTTYFYVELGYLIGEGGASPQFGKGMYFCLVGSALIFAGGVLTRSPKVKTPAIDPL